MPESFVLVGDFNLEPKDPEYDYLVGPRDGDLGRLSSKEEFVDTWVAAGNDEADGATYSTHHSNGDAQDMRIDYAFVDQSMEKRVLGVRIDTSAQGSDHQPYWVDLDYAPYD
jgi:endonuclease/exonuclease/phosphatase family metal-dependent hydrolase